MDPATAAVIAGVAQLRCRPELDGACPPLEPARLMALVGARALEDAGGGLGPGDVDLLACVDPLAWGYEDLCGRAGELLGATRASPLTCPPGGNSPGDLLSEVAARIEEGSARVGLLVGAEALATSRRARQEGITLDWTPFEGHRDFLKGQRPLTNELESRHGLVAPIHCYPLFENALRAEAGRSITGHQRFLSELLAEHAAVAAANPYAWFPTAWTPEEIRTAGPGNRWVAFPYTKRMSAVIEVDQAAACLVLSGAEAERRGIAPDRRVAVVGGGKATDAWTPTERPDFVSSPAYRAAAAAALERAGLGLDDVDLFDLYSCFPSAVELAMKAVGLGWDDPRPRTVTGGLAYAGGPGNDYATHALAAMVERLRADQGLVGYVSALGMTATKHAVVLLSADPAVVRGATGGAASITLPEPQRRGPPLVQAPTGPATIETYTVYYDRDGTAAAVPVVLRLSGGDRSVALAEPAGPAAAALTATEGVGRQGMVDAGEDGAPNRFRLEG
ncbi:MAG TPA: hypothetical protein VE152_09675 [Acidimicrobiales bacterium]|nr:hypothetical protein [Acidimicrobiales bacterium]